MPATRRVARLRQALLAVVTEEGLDRASMYELHTTDDRRSTVVDRPRLFLHDLNADKAIVDARDWSWR